jgi:hypothetical protein
MFDDFDEVSFFPSLEHLNWIRRISLHFRVARTEFHIACDDPSEPRNLIESPTSLLSQSQPYTQRNVPFESPPAWHTPDLMMVNIILSTARPAIL